MKMHFIASETETAQAALAELSALYGQNPWREAEVVVALGGDGLMLSVMHQNKGLPIYGMNRGTVGFMMRSSGFKSAFFMMDFKALTWKLSPRCEPANSTVSSSVKPYFSSR